MGNENSGVRNVSKFRFQLLSFQFHPWTKNKFLQKDSVETTDSQVRELEDEINKLTEDLKKLHEIGELEKRTNAQLEIQVNELKEKLNSNKVQKDLEANVEIAELNKKIKELQTQLDEVEKGYQKKIKECKAEQGDSLQPPNYF